MKSTTLPNWLIAGNSAIIISVSVAMVGVAIGWSLSRNIIALYLGRMLFLFPLTVGGLQYMAWVRENAWAASAVAKIHCLACLLLCLPCFVGFIVFCVSIPSGNAIDVLYNGWFVYVLCAYCGFCCRTSRLLKNRIETSKEEARLHLANRKKHFQFTVRELLGVIAIVSIVASTARYTSHQMGKQYEEHIFGEATPENIAQLPSNATDICYCRDRRGLLSYEFTIDEMGFLNWAKKQIDNHPPCPDNSIDRIAKGGPFTIERYTNRLPYSSQSTTITAAIPQGYFYEWSKGDEGFKIAYDPTKKRAYFYCH